MGVCSKACKTGPGREWDRSVAGENVPQGEDEEQGAAAEPEHKVSLKGTSMDASHVGGWSWPQCLGTARQPKTLLQREPVQPCACTQCMLS